MFHTITTTDLRRIPPFAGLPDEQLGDLAEWLQGRNSEIRLRAGDVLYKQGAEACGFYILLVGELQVTRRVGSDDIMLSRCGPGDFLGDMALLLGTPHTDTARALRPSLLLRVSSEDFHQAIGPVAGALFTSLAQRIRTTDALMSQREKLAALGKLAAGFAHELNNPASAARRAADQLREKLQEMSSLSLGFNKMTPEQLAAFSAMQSQLMERTSTTSALDPVALSDREEELAGWLDRHGVQDAWKSAPIMATYSVDTEWLEQTTSKLGNDAVDTIIPWVEGALSMTSMLEEIEQSMSRISELVSTLKSYTFMDQAPVKEVDVHEGLESTLIILRHRLKGGVEVIREYDTSLPHICAHGSELNQVWTNLIDNAIDAMEGNGKIWIRTGLDRDGDHIYVEIADNGPGVPPEIQSRIFEPFFTTKDVSVGAGLGLDIVFRIVTVQHHGDIRFSSEPGNTRFQVRLPIEMPREAEEEGETVASVT
jgi:signal transduction histidine kinase